MKSNFRYHRALENIDAILAFLLSTFFIWISAPGKGVTDTFEVIKAARAIVSDTGNLIDVNPPMMSLIVIVFDYLGHPMLGMLVMHQIMLWGGLLLIGRGLFPLSLVPRVLILLVGILPPVMGMSGAILKDVSYGAALCFSFGLICCGIRSGRRGVFWLALIPLIYATSVRTNGFFGTLPLIALTLYFLGKKSLWRAGFKALILVFVVLVSNKEITKHVLNARPIYLIQQLYMLDIMGIAADSGHYEVTDEYLWAPPKTFEQMLPLYKPNSSMYLYALRPVGELFRETGDRKLVKKLQGLWLRAIVKEPVSYIKHRFALSKLLFGLSHEPICWPVFSAMGSNPYGLTFTPGIIHQRVFDFLNKISNGVFFSGAIYMTLALILFVLAIKNRFLLTAAITSSSLLYSGPYVFIALGCDFRYILWSLMAAVIAIFVYFYEVRKENQST